MPRKRLTSLAIIATLVLAPAGVVLTATPALADTVTLTAPVADAPFDEALTSDGSTIYVADFGTSRIDVVTSATGVTTRSIPLLGRPFRVVLSADESLLYVSLGQDDEVQIVNAATGASVGTIAVTGFPYALALTATGSTLWILNNNDGTVVSYDLASQAVSAPIVVGQAPLDIAVSTDGTKVYVAGPDGVDIIDAATHVVLSQVAIPGALSITESADGSELWVGHGGGVSVISASTGLVTSTIALPGQGTDIVFGPSGSLAYVVQDGQAQIAIIDVATETIQSTLPVGGGSRSMAISADGGTLVVGNVNDFSLTIVALTPTFVATTPANGTVGATYSYRVRAPGILAVTSGELPVGLTLVGGFITGTPTVAGSSTFTITATNAAGVVSRAFTITVAAAAAVAAGAAAPAAVAADTALAATGASVGSAPSFAALLLLLGVGAVLVTRRWRARSLAADAATR